MRIVKLFGSNLVLCLFSTMCGTIAANYIRKIADASLGSPSFEIDVLCMSTRNIISYHTHIVATFVVFATCLRLLKHERCLNMAVVFVGFLSVVMFWYPILFAYKHFELVPYVVVPASPYLEIHLLLMLTTAIGGEIVETKMAGPGNRGSGAGFSGPSDAVSGHIGSLKGVGRQERDGRTREET